MMQLHELDCCAIQEISGLGDVRTSGLVEALKNLIKNAYDDFPDLGCRFIIFTQVAPYTYGDHLAEIIKDKGLGTIVTSRSLTNPNSGNRVKVFIWEINNRATMKWSRE